MLKPLPNIKPASKAIPLSRKVALHPFMMFAFACQTTFYFIFLSEHRYTLQSDFEQFFLMYGWGIIYYSSFVFFMGWPMYALVSRNITITAGATIFFTIVATIEALFGHFLIRVDQGLFDFLWHVFSTVITVTPWTFICAYYFEKPLRQAFGYDLEQVPLWKPIKRDVDVLQSLLPAEKRGKLLMLKAANQYVEVTTDKGVCDLRTTLKSLLEHVPTSEGIHVQRSIWLHKDQIFELGYERGNPRIIDVNGNVISVSRKKVDEIKKALLFSKA